MVIKLFIMLLVGIVLGICLAGLSMLLYDDYKMNKREKEFDQELRDMEQFYIAEYFNKEDK